jgi:hypothetical protein
MSKLIKNPSNLRPLAWLLVLAVFLGLQTISEIAPAQAKAQSVLAASPLVEKPLVTGISGSNQVKINGSVQLLGSKLNQVEEVHVDGVPASFFVNSQDSITIRIPVGVKPGDPAVKLFGDFGSIIFTSLFEVVATELPNNSKVTIGSFNGYVAIYTKSHQGKQLSFKIGNSWKVIKTLPANYTYNLKKIGSGKTTTVQVYIDRALVQVLQIKVK